MEFIYPKDFRNLYIPREIDGRRGEIIFEVAHHQSGMLLYWHLDDTYLGTTSDFHQMGISTTEGDHVITVVDEEGNRMERKFHAYVTQ